MADDTGNTGVCHIFKGTEEAAYPGTEEKSELQFKDALNALSVAVQAGYSVENAVSACARDLERMYPKDAGYSKRIPIYGKPA